MSPKIIGVNARSYPSQVLVSRTSVLVVLVEGDIGDYAAYAGCGAPEWVARHGDKICFEEACVHFPGGQLDAAKYRP